MATTRTSSRVPYDNGGQLKRFRNKVLKIMYINIVNIVNRFESARCKFRFFDLFSRWKRFNIVRRDTRLFVPRESYTHTHTHISILNYYFHYYFYFENIYGTLNVIYTLPVIEFIFFFILSSLTLHLTTTVIRKIPI